MSQLSTQAGAVLAERACVTATDLASLLRAHGPQLLRTATRILGSSDDAADVLQDLFVKLLRRPVKNVKSWPALLQTMVTRMALDRLRRRQRWKRLSASLQGTDATPADPASVADDRARATELRAALATLPQRQREVFSLRFFSELSYEEIAAELSLTVNHVGVLISRARQRLQGQLNLADEGEIS